MSKSAIIYTIWIVLLTLVVAACTPTTQPTTALHPNESPTVVLPAQTTRLPSPTVIAVPPTDTAIVPSPTATAAPTMTPISNTPTSPTTGSTSFLPALVSCDGAPPSRLVVGADVFINLQLSLPLRLRQAAGLDAAILDRNLAGTQMEVIGGPECADGYTWWQVREKESGITGWSAEGTFNELYLIPSGLIAYRDQYTLRTYAMSIITLLSPNGTMLYRPVNGFIGAWDISHDSRTIAYGMDSGLHLAPAARNVAEAHELGSPEARKISDDVPGWIAWSPDNTRLLYVDSEFNLKIIPVNDGQPQLLDNLATTEYTSLAWSPDGQSVAFLGDQLLIFDATTGSKRTLTDTPDHGIGFLRSGIEYVNFSPDGQQLLFSKNHGLSVIQIDGSGEMQIVEGSLRAPKTWGRWSPDGSAISYLSGGGGISTKVMVRPLDSSAGIKVAEGVLAESGVIWSENGNYLIYVDDQIRVTLLNLANGIAYKLTAWQGGGYITFETRWRNVLP